MAVDPSQRSTVLVVTPWWPTDHHPLAGRGLREQVRAVAHRMRIAVLHLDVDPRHQRGVTVGIADDAIPVVGVRYAPSNPVRSRRALEHGVRHALDELARRGIAPGVVHGNVLLGADVGMRIAKRLGVPFLYTERRSAVLPSSERPFTAREHRRARRALRRCAVAVPASDAVRRAQAGIAPDATFRVVPNAVDLDVFRPGTGVPRSATIVVAARLDRSKRLDLLLGAFTRVAAELPDARLVVAGDGPAHHALDATARAAGVRERVDLPGRLAPSVVAQLMADARVFAVTSAAETFCSAAAEALCCGVPVVSTRCGGPEDFVDESNGVLVDRGDADAIAAALRGALERDQWDHTRITHDARRRFGPARVASELEAAYVIALGDSSGGMRTAL